MSRRKIKKTRISRFRVPDEDGAHVGVGGGAHYDLKTRLGAQHIAQLAEAIVARVEVRLLFDEQIAQIREIGKAVVVGDIGDGVGDQLLDLIGDELVRKQAVGLVRVLAALGGGGGFLGLGLLLAFGLLLFGGRIGFLLPLDRKSVV